LIAEAVSNWKITAQRPLLARIFEHSRMQAASVRTAKASFPGEDPVLVAHLYNVANAFSQLYEDRRVADYDNGTRWSRTNVLTQIDLVEQAFTSWGAIREGGLANDYLLSLFVRER
jgi:arginyl-tRNA synthetase